MNAAAPALGTVTKIIMGPSSALAYKKFIHPTSAHLWQLGLASEVDIVGMSTIAQHCVQGTDPTGSKRTSRQVIASIRRVLGVAYKPDEVSTVPVPDVNTTAFV